MASAAAPPTAPILRIEPGEHTSVIWRVASDDQGRWLVSASSDKTVRLWSLADGHLLNTLRPPIGDGTEGRLQSVALSPDGTIVATAGWTLFRSGSNAVDPDGFSIYLFERASGRLLRRIAGLPHQAMHLAFSHDGRWLAAALAGKNGVRVLSVSSGQQLAEDRDYAGDSYSAHFSGDGRLVTTSWDGFVRLYRFDGGSLELLAKSAAPGGKEPFGARFSPDGQRIAVGFNDTFVVNVLDGESLALQFAPDTTGVNASLFNVAWSRDGTALFAAGRATVKGLRSVRRWMDGGTGAAIDWPVAAISTFMDLVALPNGRLAFGAGDPAWGVVDATGQKILFHAPVMADFRNNTGNFKLSHDGARVGFGYETSARSPAVFDTLNRTFLPVDTPGLVAPLLTAPGVVVTDWKNNLAPKLNGVPLKLLLREMSHGLALWRNDGGFVLGTEWRLRAYANAGAPRWEKTVLNAVRSVNVSTDGRWVVTASGDGTIRWYRASDGAEQLAFYPHPDRKRWVLWTPTGFYDAAPGAEDLIGWHLNRGKDSAADFFPASRFRGYFYRPDVIARVLASGSEAEAQRLANDEAGRKAQTTSIINVLPPVVEILSPGDGSATVTSSIVLKYGTRAPDDAPVTRLRARVNGQAVSLPDVKASAGSALAATGEITLPIPPQDSEIQLFAENRNGVSAPAVLRVSWTGVKPAPREEVQLKPKLYVLAVGVSKYANPDYNLDLAAKDARDFAAVFEKQKGKLYADVKIRLLADDKATRDDVEDGLEWLRREVTARDVGVVFIAGHGMNDNTGKYYFMPYNADPDKLLRTGVAQGDIRDTLSALAGKAVFFIDTCHSGNALGSSRTRGIGADINAFANELASAENGVVVFSASTGRQVSLENLAWGNGAFTKAVVEGLNGKADFQKTGKITHKGLDYYVAERVKELTHGLQSPVSIAPQGVTDFPIAVVP